MFTHHKITTLQNNIKAINKILKAYNWQHSMWSINTGSGNHSKYCFPFIQQLFKSQSVGFLHPVTYLLQLSGCEFTQLVNKITNRVKVSDMRHLIEVGKFDPVSNCVFIALVVWIWNIRL